MYLIKWTKTKFPSLASSKTPATKSSPSPEGTVSRDILITTSTKNNLGSWTRTPCFNYWQGYSRPKRCYSCQTEATRPKPQCSQWGTCFFTTPVSTGLTSSSRACHSTMTLRPRPRSWPATCQLWLLWRDTTSTTKSSLWLRGHKMRLPWKLLP